VRFIKKQATAVNSAFSEQADGHSPLGKKRFWRQLQAMYMCNGRAVSDTPVAMVDPDTGRVHCTPEGIVQAQANHTRTLGSQAAFAAANPMFDGEWFEEVWTMVA
jgi:hypothetical protein